MSVSQDVRMSKTHHAEVSQDSGRKSNSVYMFQLTAKEVRRNTADSGSSSFLASAEIMILNKVVGKFFQDFSNRKNLVSERSNLRPLFLL
jgi:hypothetical protein